MRPGPGEVLHFSEDPTITRFEPHVAATSHVPRPYVWAVDAARCPDYWFPRDCPRAMAWVGAGTTAEDRDAIVGRGAGSRVHAVEYRWLAVMQRAQVFAYRLPAAAFRPFVDDSGTSPAHVSSVPVEPLGPPEPVGDLLALHAEAGIQLRLLPQLWTFWDAVVASTMEFSGIRLRNATPRTSP